MEGGGSEAYLRGLVDVGSHVDGGLLWKLSMCFDDSRSHLCASQQDLHRARYLPRWWRLLLQFRWGLGLHVGCCFTDSLKCGWLESWWARAMGCTCTWFRAPCTFRRGFILQYVGHSDNILVWTLSVFIKNKYVFGMCLWTICACLHCNSVPEHCKLLISLWTIRGYDLCVQAISVCLHCKSVSKQCVLLASMWVIRRIRM